MAKKTKPPAIPTSGSAGLKHSPFAALGGRDAAAGPAEPPGDTSAPAADGGSSAQSPAKSRGRLVLRRETKHRGGKAVIVVTGFDALAGFDDRAIAELAKECKQALACGGTVDGGEIVLQGDRAADVAELLRAKGFRVAGVRLS
jgi:predicted translation initiation factor SUI1